MVQTLMRWRLISSVLGAGIVVLASRRLLVEVGMSPIQREGLKTSIVIGIGLVVFGLLYPMAARHLWADGGLDEEASPVGSAALHERRRYATLFIASFVALFVEVLLIRYAGSQVRIFAFFKNIPLIASFLGLGLGLCLGSSGPRGALRFLLWLVPVMVFLAAGAPIVDGFLDVLSKLATSEMVLGDRVAQDDVHIAIHLISQLVIAAFCSVVLVAIMLLFAHLGKLLAGAFVGVGRLAGYTVNILGSLAGILAFTALSFLHTPPWVWLLAGLVPLLWWAESRRERVLALILIAASVMVAVPSPGDTVWSSYQKLVGHPQSIAGAEGVADGYLVQISDVFYQLALDLRPEAVAEYGFNPYPHYDGAFDSIPRLDKVLIVGSGTGNDVAAALRANAGRVDAVDIDPAIVLMGRERHPEQPYDDQRVRVIVEDARRAFRQLEAGSYDAVVFGLLDSHTQLGMSSVRLDNYVFTRESFESAADLLRPGGWMIATAATFRPWFRERITSMLGASCSTPVDVQTYNAWITYRCRVDRSAGASGASTAADRARDGLVVPTDDWPFLYLENRGVPGGYLFVVGVLAFVAALVLRRSGIKFGGFTAYHGHLFFLGAGFLLMEVHAINRLALLYGTTWLVSAITIALVLSLIVAANLVVLAVGTVGYGLAYSALVVSLAVSFTLEPDVVLASGVALQYGYGLLILSPVFFAGLIFARSFRSAEVAGTALGANIFGSAVGGWLEYSTMAFGIRSMVLFAGALYLASLVAHWRHTARLGAIASFDP